MSLIPNAIEESYSDEIKKAEVLLEAMPYLQQFRGKTFVIKYGGSAMERPELVESVLKDIVLLELAGINPVIVHGGGKAISQRMNASGIVPKFISGLRVTCEKSIEIVDDILNHVINPDIVRRINEFGGNAFSVNGRKVFRAQKLPPVSVDGQEYDLGYVADVAGCDVIDVLELVRQEKVPVISPVAQDNQGCAYNVNADLAAADIARSLRANKVVFLSDVNGILEDPRDPLSTIPTVDAAKIADLKNRGIIGGGMLPKVEASLKVLEHGVEKVHFVDGRIPHALLLEIFTASGLGTEIVK